MSRDVLILACAVSAGVHAALAPEHASFVPAAVALGVLAVGLARSPAPLLVDGAIVVLGGLIVAYALAATTGIPLAYTPTASRSRPVPRHEGDRGARPARRTRVERSNTMADKHSYRPIPLALIALVALFSALAALAASGSGHDAQATTEITPEKASRPRSSHSDGHAQAWEDHVTWTRLAVISLTTGSPDTEATVGRLLQNQDDIGAPGPHLPAAKPATACDAPPGAHHDCRRAHRRAQAGNQPELARQQARWEANADEIARFLNSANPRWKLDETRSTPLEHPS